MNDIYILEIKKSKDKINNFFFFFLNRSDTFLSPPCLPLTKSLMSMSLAELISYCLIDPQTALIHHRATQYLTLLISVCPSS